MKIDIRFLNVLFGSVFSSFFLNSVCHANDPIALQNYTSNFEDSIRTVYRNQVENLPLRFRKAIEAIEKHRTVAENELLLVTYHVETKSIDLSTLDDISVTVGVDDGKSAPNWG